MFTNKLSFKEFTLATTIIGLAFSIILGFQSTSSFIKLNLSAKEIPFRVIVSSRNQEPLAGATVTLNYLATPPIIKNTDDNGYVEFNLKVDELDSNPNIIIEKENFSSVEFTLDPRTNPDTTRIIVLFKERPEDGGSR
ncbi:MAG: hypothetical protein F6J92_17345 [Symploca sp. SIO1A3]|nr:hypothetical protein [Symploca sp. SIO1A3]